MNSRRGVVIFYRFVLPVFTVANLGLGLFLLTMLRPPGWLAWLELGTGALCCCIAEAQYDLVQAAPASQPAMQQQSAPVPSSSQASQPGG